MECNTDSVARHGLPGRVGSGSAAQHTSRREIDMGIGAYMALRRCSEQTARAALIQSARDASVGLGAASHALLAVMGELNSDIDPDTALGCWREHLGAPRGGRSSAPRDSNRAVR